MSTSIPRDAVFTVTLDQAYPVGIPEIPEGWEYAQFGIPGDGETWLGLHGEPLNISACVHYAPRIIVHRPIAKPRRWIVEFPAESDRQADFSGYDADTRRRMRVIRELKPITRRQIDEALTIFYAPYDIRGVEKFQAALEQLGIEVAG